MNKEEYNFIVDKIKNMPDEEFIRLCQAFYTSDMVFNDDWLKKKPDFTNHTGNVIDYPN